MYAGLNFLSSINLLSKQGDVTYWQSLTFHVTSLILYIKMNVCLFVCMYGTYTNSHFWTDLNQTLHTSPPVVWKRLYVWTRNSRPLWPFWPFYFGGHCNIMGTRWLPARPFSAIPLYPWFQLMFAWRHRQDVADGGVIRGTFMSVILAGVPLTSRKWRCSRRQSHPPQRHIPYSGGCSRHVTDITFKRATGPSATASYPLFWWVFASRHGYYVQAGDGAIHHSVISFILAPVSVPYRKSRPCRQQLRVPTPSMLHCR